MNDSQKVVGRVNGLKISKWNGTGHCRSPPRVIPFTHFLFMDNGLHSVSLTFPVFQMAESIRARSWFLIPLDSSVGTKALTPVEDGNFRLTARFLEYWSTTVLPHVYLHAKSLQLCLILCDPVHHSPLGTPVHGILQARKLYPVQGCCALLQGIFPTQGSNPHLLCLPALARGFFATSAIWEVPVLPHYQPIWRKFAHSGR